jgi:ClpP class serine protease
MMAEGGYHNANEIIEEQIRSRLQTLEEVLSADVITYIGPITDLHHAFLKSIIDSLTPKREKLAVVLETEGGFIESAERIANIFRHNYETVEFLVPTFAMSAGTVLVMSGDAIYMDYGSTLGPIDPQVKPIGKNFVPALGYLEQYDRLVKKSAAGEITPAEMAYMLQNFDPAELYQYEQARDLSIALLKEWLAKYKFENWTVTATRKEPVTDEMRADRAERIASDLNDTSVWHSHNRGISMEVLRRRLKLQIEDIDANPKLKSSLQGYMMLLLDYMHRRGHGFVVFNWREGYHGH